MIIKQDLENGAKWRLKNENEKIRLLKFCIYAHKTHISGINYLSFILEYKFPNLKTPFLRDITRYMSMVDSSQKLFKILTFEFFRV